jgi:hypothetical protein
MITCVIRRHAFSDCIYALFQEEGKKSTTAAYIQMRYAN